MEYRMEEIYPLLREVTESGGEFRLCPRGTSMLPLLREGRDSVVLIAPRLPLRKRAVYLYRRQSGAFVLHRCIGFKNGAPVFCGDNQLTPEYGVTPEMVLAEMCAFYRGERRVACTSLRYRVWVRLHGVRLFRRIFFFCRRVWHKLFCRKK